MLAVWSHAYTTEGYYHNANYGKLTDLALMNGVVLEVARKLFVLASTLSLRRDFYPPPVAYLDSETSKCHLSRYNSVLRVADAQHRSLPSLLPQ